MRVLAVSDEAYLEHAPGNWPEGPHRLEAVWKALEETGVGDLLELRSPVPASEEDVSLVHTSRHIERVKEVARGGGGYLTLDTVVSPKSYDIALLAVGGVLTAVDAVLGGEAKRAAALVRPPGHHATAEEGMGFCLFNNVAIAAAHALSRRGLERVLIVDWDLHHGNGTEAVFYDSRKVLFVSCHESPAYPGTGWITDTGEGEGEGFTVNIPFPAGTGDDAYLEAFDSVVAPIARAFRPELVLVSCGLDAHFLDPLGRLELTSRGYGRLSGVVCGLADELCGGKVVFVLEGGYDPVGLGWSLASVLSVAAGRDPVAEPEGCRREEAEEDGKGRCGRGSGARAGGLVISSVLKTQRAYWPV